ncbi:MAG: hypothetical protein ABIY70_09375 [Capsulimonas sp.]|uniref:right-handed parallel beta-helix repeat-containing protein n=1 Tax=Capsulimonas sp. TaxID=2494211 RepID=UPI003265C426
MTIQSMKTFVIAGAALAFATSAHAQATRTWVSGVGDDVNPCSRTAPCKTFAGAISKTAAGGEIDTLDPGGYGTVTITKSITIDGGGSLSSILFSGTNGVIVNAASTDTVTLRNLSFDGGGTGLNGIRYIAGGALNVQKCDIFSFSNYGIDVSLTAAGKVTIKDTTITGGARGVSAITTAGNLFVSGDNVTVNNAYVGIDLGYGYGQFTNSMVTKCGTVGLLGEGGFLTFSNGVISSCGTAARVYNPATIRLSNDDLLDNGLNYGYTGAGKIASAGNNHVAGGGVATPNATMTTQ